jgi:hypothetical protein
LVRDAGRAAVALFEAGYSGGGDGGKIPIPKVRAAYLKLAQTLKSQADDSTGDSGD